jgi:hypothetical protein
VSGGALDYVSAHVDRNAKIVPDQIRKLEEEGIDKK